MGRTLDQKVTVTEQGRKRRVSRREVIAMRSAEKAMAGDLRHAEFLARHDPALAEALGEAASVFSSEADELTRKNLARRLSEALAPSYDSESSQDFSE